MAAIRAGQQAITERNIAISGQLISRTESLGDANPALSRLLSVAAGASTRPARPVTPC